MITPARSSPPTSSASRTWLKRLEGDHGHAPEHLDQHHAAQHRRGAQQADARPRPYAAPRAASRATRRRREPGPDRPGLPDQDDGQHQVHHVDRDGQPGTAAAAGWFPASGAQATRPPETEGADRDGQAEDGPGPGQRPLDRRARDRRRARRRRTRPPADRSPGPGRCPAAPRPGRRRRSSGRARRPPPRRWPSAPATISTGRRPSASARPPVGSSRASTTIPWVAMAMATWLTLSPRSSISSVTRPMIRPTGNQRVADSSSRVRCAAAAVTGRPVIVRPRRTRARRRGPSAGRRCSPRPGGPAGLPRRGCGTRPATRPAGRSARASAPG